MTALVLRNVRPLGGAPCDLGIAGGRVIAAQDIPSDARTVDCSGLIALPGLVDLHTHLREPGCPEAETVESGTLAAARGGYTAVFAMANTYPVADTATIVERVASLGRQTGRCDVYPVGAVSAGLGGLRLADIGGMAASSARVRMFSDDGKCVADSALMRDALTAVRDVGGVLAQHAQDPRLTLEAQLNEGRVSNDLGLPGWPAMAEEAIIARDVVMAHHLGARLHICHVSTVGSVEIIRWAKAQGFPVTAEVTPHHLTLIDELARTKDARFKVNPPLRTAEDVKAVGDALVDGTIDVVATDHAPHPRKDKAQEWSSAPMGMLGLETALAIVAEVFVETGRLNWQDVALRMSGRPAEILGITDEHGNDLVPGANATLCLVDPSRPWSVNPESLASLSANTPFGGRQLRARVVATVLRGEITHDFLGLDAGGHLLS
ncbi:MAG: dihydroorotase [Dermatophilaceae bacterium]